MPGRFEVVPPPVEERLQAGIAGQVEATFQTYAYLVSGVESRKDLLKNNTNTFLEDTNRVQRVSHASVSLLSPTQLPGFCLFLAVLLRLFHYTFVCRMARAVISEQESRRNEKAE